MMPRRYKAGDRAGADRPAEPLVQGLIFTGQSGPLSGCESCPERHGAEQSSELISAVLQECGQRQESRVIKQAGGISARDLIVPQPRLHLRDVVASGRHTGQGGAEIAIGRPVGPELRRNGCDGGTPRLLIVGAARIFEPKVRDQREGPAVDEHVGHRAPANIRVDPMDRRRREHSRVLSTRRHGVLQACVDELHVAHAVEPIASAREQLLARLHGCNT